MIHFDHRFKISIPYRSCLPDLVSLINIRIAYLPIGIIQYGIGSNLITCGNMQTILPLATDLVAHVFPYDQLLL